MPVNQSPTACCSRTKAMCRPGGQPGTLTRWQGGQASLSPAPICPPQARAKITEVPSISRPCPDWSGASLAKGVCLPGVCPEGCAVASPCTRKAVQSGTSASYTDKWDKGLGLSGSQYAPQ